MDDAGDLYIHVTSLQSGDSLGVYTSRVQLLSSLLSNVSTNSPCVVYIGKPGTSKRTVFASESIGSFGLPAFGIGGYILSRSTGTDIDFTKTSFNENDILDILIVPPGRQGEIGLQGTAGEPGTCNCDPGTPLTPPKALYFGKNTNYGIDGGYAIPAIYRSEPNEFSTNTLYPTDIRAISDKLDASSTTIKSEPMQGVDLKGALVEAYGYPATPTTISAITDPSYTYLGALTTKSGCATPDETTVMLFMPGVYTIGASATDDFSPFLVPNPSTRVCVGAENGSYFPGGKVISGTVARVNDGSGKPTTRFTINLFTNSNAIASIPVGSYIEFPQDALGGPSGTSAQLNFSTLVGCAFPVVSKSTTGNFFVLEGHTPGYTGTTGTFAPGVSFAGTTGTAPSPFFGTFSDTDLWYFNAYRTVFVVRDSASAAFIVDGGQLYLGTTPSDYPLQVDPIAIVYDRTGSTGAAAHGVIVKNGGTVVSDNGIFASFLNKGAAIRVNESRVDLKNNLLTNNSVGVANEFGRIKTQTDNINFNSVGILADSASSVDIKRNNMKFNELGILASNNSSVKSSKTEFKAFNRQTAILVGTNGTLVADGCTFVGSTISLSSGIDTNDAAGAVANRASVGAVYGSDSFVRVTNSTIVGHSTLVGSRGDIGSGNLSGNSFVFKPSSVGTGVLGIDSESKTSDIVRTNILPLGINTSAI